MKPFWEISQEEATAPLEPPPGDPAMTEYFRGGGYSSNFLSRGGMPVTMCRINLVKGLGPVLQIAEGWTVDLPAEGTRYSRRAHQPHLAHHLVRAQRDRQRRRSATFTAS